MQQLFYSLLFSSLTSFTLAAVSLQPNFRPTSTPTTTASPVSTLPDSSIVTADATSIVIIIIIIICCCGGCGYYYNRDNQNNNTSRGAAYTAVSVPTARPTVTATITRVVPKKIDSAVTIMNKFLSSMMGARDRCSIVSFSDKYNIRQNLSSSAPCIASLDACRYSTGGGTALYDAAVASVVQFAATADRTRPWLLIILTDGEDTNSRTKPSELIEVLKLFNQASSNFVFVVGLGASLQDTELRRICEQSKSLYLRANDIETMQLMFALIAL
eukprot:gene12691-13900_t